MNMKLYAMCICFFSICACTQQKPQSIKNFAEIAALNSIEQTDKCHETCIALKKEFRYVVYVGEKIYCYWDEKKAKYNIDFNSKAVEIENQITDTMTETEYYLQLVKWASLFRDGHVNPLLKKDLSQFDFYNPSVRFEVIAPGSDHESLIISKVDNDINELKVGTVVDKIQGKPWRSYIDLVDSISLGSTEYMRKRQFAYYIFRALLLQEGPQPINIVGTFQNQTIQETIPRKLTLYDFANTSEDNGTGMNLISSSILENNIGYIRIDGFSGSKMPDLISQAMERLKTTDALLIDVRENGGGDQSGNALIKYLIDKPTVRYKHRSIFSDLLIGLRSWIGFEFDYKEGKFTEFKERKIEPSSISYRYKGPVAVLTSSQCFSACDTFVSALKENKLATVLGENTGGGTGTPQVFDLPVSGHQFRYSVFQGITAVTNTLIEGVGTAPDVVLEPTIEERVEKKDRQLAKAITWLRNKIGLPEKKSVIPYTLLNLKLKPISDLAPELEMDRIIKKYNEN